MACFGITKWSLLESLRASLLFSECLVVLFVDHICLVSLDHMCLVSSLSVSWVTCDCPWIAACDWQSTAVCDWQSTAVCDLDLYVPDAPARACPKCPWDPEFYQMPVQEGEDQGSFQGDKHVDPATNIYAARWFKHGRYAGSAAHTLRTRTLIPIGHELV